jgi:hypothetical protein
MLIYFFGENFSSLEIEINHQTHALIAAKENERKELL